MGDMAAVCDRFAVAARTSKDWEIKNPVKTIHGIRETGVLRWQWRPLCMPG